MGNGKETRWLDQFDTFCFVLIFVGCPDLMDISLLSALFALVRAGS